MGADGRNARATGHPEDGDRPISDPSSSNPNMTTPAKPTPNATRVHPAVLVVLFVTLAAWYLALRAYSYDGESIKYAVWNEPGPKIEWVSHPYSDAWYWVWWKLGEGFVSTDFDDRMRWMEALNSILGAASVTLGAAALLRFGAGVWATLLSVLTLGLARNYFFDSTLSNEPMMAQFWLSLSLLFTAKATAPGSRLSWTLLSGASWALAVAAYQTYVLGGLGILWLMGPDRRRQVVWTITAAIVGFSLYLTAAVLYGGASIAALKHYFFTKTDAGIWGFFTWSGFIKVFLGLSDAMTHMPRPGGGLRTGLQSMTTGQIALMCGIVAIISSLAVLVVLTRVEDSHKRTRIGFLILLAGSLFAPYYLDPYYNKLWPQPLLALAAVTAFVIGRSPRRLAFMAMFLVALFTWNLQGVYFSRLDRDNYMSRGARVLEESLTEKDLMICEGWDTPILYNIRNPRRPYFGIIWHDVSAEALESKIRETRAAGGRVYFMGLVDMTPEEFERGQLPERGKAGWLPIVQSYKPRVRLVWKGEEKRLRQNLYELVQ